MRRRSILAAGAGLVLAAAAVSGASAQAPPRLKDAIIGSWALVSFHATRPDGSAAAPYGPRAAGTALFERNGRFTLILVNSDIPRFASNDREKPTSAEAMAAASGSTAMFGSYSVNGVDRSVIMHVEASSYPNDSGTDQTRLVKAISETALVLVAPASPNGGATTELTFKKIE
jgi:hypothetical protein